MKVLRDLTMPWTPLATPLSHHSARTAELTAGKRATAREREVAVPFAWTYLHLVHRGPEKGEGEVDTVHRGPCLWSMDPHGTIHHGPASVD